METALTSPFFLLKKAWTLALQRSNIFSFLLLGAIPQLISLAVTSIFAYTNGKFDMRAIIGNLTDSLSGTSGVVYVIGLLVIGIAVVLFISLITTWYTALLYRVYQATIEGSLAPLTTYARPAKEVTIRLLLTYMTVGLFTTLGFLLLIIPGIIIAVRYMFAPMIAAVEDRSVKPIEESKRLVKGRFWKLVGRSIVMIVAYNTPASILQALHPALGMVWSVTSPIFGLYYFLIYQDFKKTAAVAI